MLSDEEREALEILNNTEWDGFMITIKNLINKQSKEIEELKEDKYGLEEEVQMQAKNIMICENALCEMQDKIKAKIEPKLKELDEQINEEWKKYGNSKELQDMEDMYNFLQSLLEKED